MNFTLEPPIDFLVIADSRDQFAAAITKEASYRGYVAQHLDFMSAGRIFSIEMTGATYIVHPGYPVLLRPPIALPLGSDSDTLFHFSECVAAIWSAVALSHSKVISRPGRYGLAGRCSFSSALTEMRAGCFQNRPEVFASSPAMLSGLDSEWAVQNQTSFIIKTLGELEPNTPGPLRSRPVDLDEGYELVVVLEQQAWRISIVGLEHLKLESRSIELVAHLDLNFAVVVWAVNKTLSSARIARVEPWPSLNLIFPVASEVLLAVIKVLCS